jgi:hypothetical protein
MMRTTCQMTQHYIPKDLNPGLTCILILSYAAVYQLEFPPPGFSNMLRALWLLTLITNYKWYCVIKFYKYVKFTNRCLIVCQQHRQYIPCFSDEAKLNYPKKSSLNAERQALYLQLMIKYAKKCSFPTQVKEKELQQYEVCVFCVFIYTYICIYSRAAQVLGARWRGQLNILWWHLIFVGPWYGTCFRSPFCHLEFWSGIKIFGKFVHSWCSF